MLPLVIRFRKPVAFVVIVCALLVTSCATTQQGQQEQAVGALAGAALGALVGGLIGGDWKSAVIGATAGGLTGWAAVTLAQYQAAQVRSADEDQKIYGISRVGDTPVVKIRQAACLPERITPGQQIEVSMDYSVSPAQGTQQVVVEEQWILKKEGRQSHVIGSKSGQRAAGGYRAGGYVETPSSLEPGAYFIEHRVQAGSSYDVYVTVLYVGG